MIDLLNGLDENDWPHISGLVYKDRDAAVIQNPPASWNEKYLQKVSSFDQTLQTGERHYFVS